MKTGLSSQKTVTPKKGGFWVFGRLAVEREHNFRWKITTKGNASRAERPHSSTCRILSVFRPLSSAFCFSTSVLCLLTSTLLSSCITTQPLPVQPVEPKPNPYVKPLTLPAWLTAPDDRERRGVPVDLEMKLPDALRPFEYRYALPPWMIYGTVRALGMQRMWVKGDLKSYSLAVDGKVTELPEEDSLIYFVPENDIHRALLKIVKDCSDAEDEDELNEKISRYIQCLYKDQYALFTLNPSGSAFGSGASRTMEIFKPGRDDLPVIGWITTEQFHETTVAATYKPAYPLESFQKAEELAIRDLVEGVAVKLQSLERVENVAINRVGSKLTESAVKESLNLELRGVQVVRRAVDVEQGICLVAVRVPRSGIIVR